MRTRKSRCGYYPFRRHVSLVTTVIVSYVTHKHTSPLTRSSHARTSTTRCHAQPFTMKWTPLPRPDSAQHAARASAQHATCSPGRATLTHSMAGVRPWCEIQSNLSSIARGANSRRVHEELEDSHADHAASQHSQRERTSERQPVSKQPASSGVLSASVRLSRSQYAPVCSSEAACHEQVGQKSSEVHDCPSLPEPTSPDLFTSTLGAPRAGLVLRNCAFLPGQTSLWGCTVVKNR